MLKLFFLERKGNRGLTFERGAPRRRRVLTASTRRDEDGNGSIGKRLAVLPAFLRDRSKTFTGRVLARGFLST